MKSGKKNRIPIGKGIKLFLLTCWDNIRFNKGRANPAARQVWRIDSQEFSIYLTIFSRMEVKVVVVGNLIACAFLTGLIWFVQIVHYPSFAKVSPEQFVVFHNFHTTATGGIVVLPMLAELLLSFLLLGVAAPQVGVHRFWLMGLLLGVWALTFFVFVPLHGQLSAGYDLARIERLVQWNWARTALWTARCVGLAWLAWRVCA